MSHIYDRLGVKRRINGAGSLTRLGGSLMDEAVLAAMRQAADAFVDIAELQTAAGAVIARHTGSEAGLVTSGAAAALTLAAAACLTRHDVARMERLPDTSGMANEIVIHRLHRTGYDHALRAAGARLVEIGFNDRGTGAGVRGLEAWEIEAAIGPGTVAVAYTASPAMQPPLATVAEVAARHGLPVIVDAAAQLPPKDNLRRFLAEGASLVAFSGGKAIRGPQGTGILCGRKDLVSAALIQQLDMDVSPETWNPPAGLLAPELKARFPHHGLGRGFKVDKESIVGLIVSLERFVEADLWRERRAKRDLLAGLAALLAGTRGVATTLDDGGARSPTLDIAFDEAALGLGAFEISRRLQRHDPPVHLGERAAHDGRLIVDPAGLRPGDEAIVAAALKAALANSKL